MPITLPRPSSARGRKLAPALAAAALLLAPTAAKAAGWIDGPEIRPTNLSGGGDYVGAPDGSGLGVWVQSDLDNNPEVRTQQITAAGTKQPSVEIGGGDFIGQPVAAIGPDGAIVVAWWELTEDEDHELRVATLGSDGAPTRTPSVVSTVANDDEANLGGAVGLAVDGTGDATVAWAGVDDGGASTVQAAHVASNGDVMPFQLDAAADYITRPEVAVTPSGVAWVAWYPDDFESASLARLTVDGGVPTVTGPVEVTDSQTLTGGVVRLAASEAGGVLAWREYVQPGGMRATAERLPLTGDLEGERLHGPVSEALLQINPDVAIAPDGVVTIAQEAFRGAVPDDIDDFDDVTTTVELNRFGADSTSASTQTIADPPAGKVAGLPTIASAPDGSLFVTWFQFSSPPTAQMVARPVAADGTLGPLGRTVGVSLEPDIFSGSGTGIGTRMVPVADGSGGGPVGVLTPSLLGGFSLSTYYFDAVAPVVDVQIPPMTWTSSLSTFSATATDRTAVDLWWDFGDDSGSRRATVNHRYTDPGTYTVTLTATDAVGNETVVTRAVRVVQLIGDPPPPAPPAPPVPPAQPAPKVAAALKLVEATRSGARVTVRGAIAGKASGRVTILYAQKIGRRTAMRKATAKIAKGRWSVTFRLTGRLARARGKATVTAAYAGDAAVGRASARRAVATAKAKKKPAPHKRRG